jgi:hypothetical protein
MTLQEQGFRFICRDGACNWMHPAEVQPNDVDCTDMDEDEFEAFVFGISSCN